MQKIIIHGHRILGKHLLLILTVSYFLIISVYMLWHGMWLSPDQFLIAGLLIAIFMAKPLLFLKDWLPFITLFLAYEYLRGLVPKLHMDVNIFPMINADNFLFGSLPTIELQKLFYTPGDPAFYDYVFTIIYMMHFIIPLIFAFFLWAYKKHHFRKFLISLTALSMATFFTYIIYPAMPPWMASEKGFIPHVYNVFNDTLHSFVKTASLPTIYKFMNPNPVAAMPSLHAAYPTLVYLFLVRIYGQRAKIFILYPMLVWFAIIYTGHHYVIDAIVGIIYALIIYKIVTYYYEKKQAKLETKEVTSQV